MQALILILCAVTVAAGIHEHRRMKYEVFGIAIVPGRGSEGVERRLFRTEKEALRYYYVCRDKYSVAVMRPL